MAGYAGPVHVYRWDLDRTYLDTDIRSVRGMVRAALEQASEKRTIPGAALAFLPRSGHAINLEEPALFNQLVEDFFRQVESGRYTKRDKRSTVPSIYGPSGKP